ncbi:MAG: phytanoyl-CoA dioxygenase family protein [Gammaproteobacteria bacterium]|nr:phytanoyl-CoA dioxygenase family protein [Gammaproteobacteria bacterium]
MSSNGNTKEDIATVYGEEVQVPGLSGWLAEIDEQGYVMVPDWISPERVERLGEDLRREVNPIRELMGPDKTTVRAHNLLGKTRCVDDLVCDQRLLALAQGVLGYKIQVSVVVMFDLLPGAKAQGLHQDDGLWPLPRPHPPFVVNVVIAVDDFTKENGATVLVPGSHKWHDQKVRQPPDVETIQVEMGAGAPTRPRTRAGSPSTSTSTCRTSASRRTSTSVSRAKRSPRCLIVYSAFSAYQHGMSIAGPGMVDLRDPLKMMDRVHFGYDINGPDIPAIG